MNEIFKELFKYGFHDTEITNIFIDRFEVKINFDNGLYILDKNGKETILSDPISLVLNIKSYVNSVENCIEIREFGKKTAYIDFKKFQKQFKNGPFSVAMNYIGVFNNSILFDGGFLGKQIIFSIDEIDSISISRYSKRSN